jgi:hypothetical protein
MSIAETLSDGQIEQELVRISRPRNRSQLQPRVTGLRAVLKRRKTGHRSHTKTAT